MICLSIDSLIRHAGLDPASRRRPDESREPFRRPDPGFQRELWILALAGMTILFEAAIYKQTLIRNKIEDNTFQGGML
jgi:hypothetical protein